MKKCLICNTVFEKKTRESISEWEKRKYCKYECYWKSKIGNSPWNKGIKAPQISRALKGRVFSKDWIKNLSISHIGKKQSKETIEKRSSKLRRENHYEWLGDNVGYGALHAWVKKELGLPDKCEHCDKDGLFGQKIHWANKTGLYKRDITDWIRLCVSCHRKYDYKNKISMKK